MTTAVEETLVLVKPDGVARNLTGEILRRIEAKGYSLVDLRMLQADRDLLAQHYAEHEGKPFYEPLVEFMESRPDRRHPRRGQPGHRGLPLARRHDRPDHGRARHDPRRPRPRLGPQGAAEPRARLRLARVGGSASSPSGSSAGVTNGRARAHRAQPSTTPVRRALWIQSSCDLGEDGDDRVADDRDQRHPAVQRRRRRARAAPGPGMLPSFRL